MGLVETTSGYPPPFPRSRLAVVPEAKTEWIKGAKQLLDSENVKRSTRKA